MSSSRAAGARLALILAAAVAGPAVLSSCGGSGSAPGAGAQAPSTSPVPASTTSTTTAPTTTVDPNTPPPAPQPTSEQASAAFINGWMAGNRARSASVATPAAVATLYATAYAGQPLTDRGCTDAFPPIECTWGPYAGGAGSIYQVQVTQAANGWYVSGVTIDS